MRVVDNENGKWFISNHSMNENDEWFTPQEFVESARAVLGHIDLDPASCEEAQEYIRAGKIYTKENSALVQDAKWEGKVWMNPPYSRVIRFFIEKLVSEIEAGNVTEAIVLTNNGTETNWFQDLNKYSSAICLTKGRIHFIRNGEPTNNNNKGQVFTYIGNNPERFRDVFTQHGTVFIK